MATSPYLTRPLRTFAEAERAILEERERLQGTTYRPPINGPAYVFDGREWAIKP